MSNEESQQSVEGKEKAKKLIEKDAFSATLPFMSIPMIAIGHIYMSDCTVQPHIPTFLLVGGYSGIVRSLLALVMKYYWEEDNTACKAIKVGGNLLSLFIMIWYIVGSVWVYGVKTVHFEDTTSEEYCDKTLYNFSWWLLTIYWILSLIYWAVIIAVAIFCGVLCACCAACLSLKK